ncbi:hypothetical protein ACI2JN_05490 [Ochrobactrum teleogrylli]|uniref:hypothetical protein n=1 Tax=Ochrobactrum teleogrylli TaxID=2479765 RepID=UPI00384F86CF
MYFKPNQLNDWFSALTLIVNSNYQLLLNISTKLASYAPIQTAPLVTTYFSIMVSALLPLLFGKIANDHGASLVVTILSVIVIAIAPMTFEIYATSTNIQWYCGAIIFALLFVKLDSIPWLTLAIILSFLCGLTGVPSVIITPAFFLIWLFNKSRGHLYIAITLLACTAIQAVVVIGIDNPARVFTTSPRLLLLPSLLHSVLGFWLTPNIVQAVGKTALVTANFIAITVFSGLILGAIVWINEPRLRYMAALALIVGIGAAIVQTFGSLGDPIYLLGGPANGGRYYFVSTCAITIAIMLSSTNKTAVPAIILTSAIIVQGIGTFAPAWVPFSSGPSWTDGINKCKTTTCTFDIWPSGLTVELNND